MNVLTENLIFHTVIIFGVLLWKWSHDETAKNAFLVWLLCLLVWYGPQLIVGFMVWKCGHLPPL